MIRNAETSTPGGSWTGSPSIRSSIGSPADRRLADEILDPAEARLRRERELVIVLAQHAEQPAHLGQGLFAGRLDRVERRTRLVSVVRQFAAASARLQNHHADRVRHHVVQLARDPYSLERDRLARFRIAFALELRRAAVQRRFAFEPATDHAPSHERPRESDCDEGGVGDAERLARLDRRERERHHEHDRAGDRRATVRYRPAA